MTSRHRPALTGASLFTAWILLTSSPAGIFVRVETQVVPVDRLVANLERDLGSNPNKAQAHINLGRLHGMAYALKTDELPAVAMTPGNDQPWYGYEPKPIPYSTKPAPNPEAEAKAKAHLEKAIGHYEAALKLDPTSGLARLGYAWMLDQAGQKARAIDEYRKVVADGWVFEQKAKMATFQRFVTSEAAGYLIPLLDPQRDEAETRDLRAKIEQLQRLPRPITPIAIPLEEHVDMKTIGDPLARVSFDADGSGRRREWTWITRDAGWLVYDAKDKGEITSALQWFGNVTFWLFWENGYEALGALDDDADGELAGEELKHLAIWHDRNGNGVSDRGEVQPLACHDVVALSTAYVAGDGVTFAAVSPRGLRLADGRSRPTYDVLLRSTALTLTRNDRR
jgi:tetratricopeptide (TPR) repeat protein